MKGVFCCALLLVLDAHGHEQKVSPVQKVVELLEGLKGKVANDLSAEEAEMVEYSKYCDDTASEKGYAIKTARKAIERLQADVEDGQAKIEAAETDISSLGAESAKKETELANAMALRKSERGDFKKTEASLVKAEDELQAAEVVVKREMGAAFLQFQKDKNHANAKPALNTKAVKAITTALSKVIDSTTVMNAEVRSTLQGFMQAAETSGDEDKDLQMPASEAPEAANYENHSGGIVDTIKDLEVKDEDQLSATRKSEMQNQHSFDMMKMSMDDAINLLKKKIADATAAKGALAEQVAASEGEMAETEKTKAADEAFLEALNTDCATAAKNWEDRKKSAAEEMAAIDKAKEILSTGVTALFQVKKKGDDDQVDDKEDVQRAEVQKVLKNLGHKYNSYAMMELASAAGSDPFSKIKGLIEDMVAKLMEEAAQEADHKAFCDEELGKSRKSKNEKSRKIDQYRSRIDEAATTKATLEESVKELQAEVAALDQSQAEATKLRSEEHATFLQASSDYKNSAEAVEKAMAVLSEYYGKAFVQVKASKNTGKGTQPEFGSKTGSDTASTILSILEVSASDFTKMLAETEAAEAEGAAAFEKLTDDNKVAKAAMLAEIRGKTSETKSLTVALAHHNEDYKGVEKEYGAVLEYLDKLKPECETKVMSYAEKKQRRENEIEGLKEALGIIEGTAVPSVGLIQRH